MKIVVLTGSSHKKGTTARLAAEFIRGAEEAGHEVYRFDAAFKKVHPCIACFACQRKDDGCVFKDDMVELNPKLLEADAIVFVSPIFYCNFTAQLKAVLDRFFANDDALKGHKKTALLTAMNDVTMRSAEGLDLTFKNTAVWLEWDVAGIVNAVHCPTAESLEGTTYLKEAYELGKNI